MTCTQEEYEIPPNPKLTQNGCFCSANKQIFWILPYPVVSCCIMLYTVGSCRTCRILPYPAVSCRILCILPYPATSCRILRILPCPAVSCHSCRILRYPAVSCRSCRIMPHRIRISGQP